MNKIAAVIGILLTLLVGYIFLCLVVTSESILMGDGGYADYNEEGLAEFRQTLLDNGFSSNGEIYNKHFSSWIGSGGVAVDLNVLEDEDGSKYVKIGNGAESWKCEIFILNPFFRLSSVYSDVYDSSRLIHWNWVKYKKLSN